MDYDCTEHNDYISMQKLVQGLFDLSHSYLSLSPDHADRKLTRIPMFKFKFATITRLSFPKEFSKTIGIYRLVPSSSE
jgi:hypothetical protein